VPCLILTLVMKQGETITVDQMMEEEISMLQGRAEITAVMMNLIIVVGEAEEAQILRSVDVESLP